MDIWTITAFLLMLAGLAGTILPLVPGTPLILLGAIVYAIATDFAAVDGWLLALLAVACVGAELLEYVAGTIGARRYGASRAGVWGALLGGLAGLLVLGPVGILVGPIAGAVAGELLAGTRGGQAIRAGLGALIGTVAGVLLKFLVGMAMVATVLVRIWYG